MITLAMACVLMGWWIRSSVVKDHLTSTDGLGYSIQLTSFDGHVGFVVREGFARTSGPETRWRQSATESLNEWAAERDGWRWYALGFGMIDDRIQGRGSLTAWFVHFGLIVIPLTLVSAWLLLSRLRSTPALTQSTGEITARQNAHDAI